MTVAKLKLSLDAAGRGSVSLDGMELTCVTAIEFGAKAGELTQIKLTVFADIDAEITARLDQIALAKREPGQDGEPSMAMLDGKVVKVRKRTW